MSTPTIRAVSLPDAGTVPALGLGTWYMGERPDRRPTELAALRTGIENGLTLIDTAEMYGDGAAEELVSEAIAGQRDSIYLVSKVVPSHATRR
ncbi:MAG: aldo/keto reductase, partial [Jiangellaceae bacterium]